MGKQLSSVTAYTLAGSVALVLSACEMGSMVFKDKDLGTTRVLATSAEVRLSTTDRADYDVFNQRIRPTRIYCAEPSPDLAKAVQESFGMGGGLGVDVQGQASAAAALSLARARAESAAQLGERLATIQLLRDGLYRACEAYANGAMTETTYAVLLSRYDDTMVTMLMGELAAGSFGRSLASLGGGAFADASGDASLDSSFNPGSGQKLLQDASLTATESEAQAKASKKAAEEAQKTLEESEAAVKTAESAKDASEQDAAAKAKKAEDAQATLNSAPAADQTPAQKADAAATKKDAEKAEAKLEKDEENLDAANAQLAEDKKDAEEKQHRAEIDAKTAATAVAVAYAVGAGQIANKPDVETAKVLATMQRKYIENINADALAVACITALSKPSNSHKSPLVDACMGSPSNPGSGLLAKILTNQKALIEQLGKRRIPDKVMKDFMETADDLSQLRKHLDQYREADETESTTHKTGT